MCPIIADGLQSLILRGQDLPLRDGVAWEGRTFNQCVATSSHPREGIQVFNERRRPEL